MSIEELLLNYTDKGFAYLIAIYLLYRFHTTDREYLKVLQELSTTLKQHIAQKDAALQMLKEKKGE